MNWNIVWFQHELEHCLVAGNIADRLHLLLVTSHVPSCIRCMALASAAGLSNVKKEIQSAPPNLASIVSCFHLAQQTTATATNANTSSIDGAYGSCNDILDELVPHLIWKVLVFRDAFPTFPNIPYAFVGNGATMSGTDEG